MDLQLIDKVVILTGGAKGIGAAITRASVREGAISVIVDRDLPACDKLFAELQLERGRGRRGMVDLRPPDRYMSFSSPHRLCISRGNTCM
jgi:NAD(P)-dependent dehydrogenase (short-subunit alcohol dehydrogenase family)